MQAPFHPMLAKCTLDAVNQFPARSDVASAARRDLIFLPVATPQLPPFTCDNH